MPEEKTDATLEKAKTSMGYGADPANKPQESEEEKVESEDETSEEEEEAKPEEESEEEESEDGDESDDEEDEENEDDESSRSQKLQTARFKPTPAERAIFAQLGELQGAIKALEKKTSEKPESAATKKEDDSIQRVKERVAKVIANLKAKNPDQAIDEDGLTAIYSDLNSFVQDELKSSGVLKEELSKDDKENLNKLKAELEEKSQEAEFSNEWNDFLPKLSNAYPNASDAQKSEAKELLKTMAHTTDGGRLMEVDGRKVIVGYPLDVIVYRNQKAFDAILKVAPKSKGAETGSHDISEEETELTEESTRQDRMNSQTAKRLQKKLQIDDDGIRSLPMR